MAEGVKSSGGTVTETLSSSGKREIPPEPAEDTDRAPRGWRFDKQHWRWVPRLAPGRKPKNDARSEDQTGGARTPWAESRADDVERDPDPGWMREPIDDRPVGKIAFGEVPQQVKDDIAGLTGLVGIPILSLLQQIDPYCGSALAQNFEPTVDAALPLICRSERIVRYFADDKSDWLLWGKLALALKPVGQAILQHHVFRTVEVVRDEHGVPHVQPRSRGGETDHQTPPVQPEFSYAA
jgi:hypothetical protein